MARPNKSGGRKAEKKKFGRGNIHAIWNAVDVPTWFSIFKKANSNLGFELKGHSIKCKCPYPDHDDGTPSFSLDFSKGIGKCFGCGKTVTDIIEFYATTRQIPYTAAEMELNKEINLGEFLGGDSAELTKYHVKQEMLKETACALKSLYEQYITEKPEHLSYFKAGYTYLTVGRQLDASTLMQLPVRIWAKPEHIKALITEDYRELFDNYFEILNNRFCWGSPCFYYNDSPNTISCFKVRKIAPAALTKGIPENITVADARNLCTKEFQVTAQGDNGMGFFGLHHYTREIERTPDVYVTEGEFDSLSVMNAQLQRNGKQNFIILGAGGMGTTKFGMLSEYGLNVVHFLQDSPHKRGDEIARTWITATGKTRKVMTLKVFIWPDKFSDAGDIDDVVNHYGYDDLYETVVLRKGEVFLNASAWAERNCMEVVDKVVARLNEDIDVLRSQAEIHNMEDTDVYESEESEKEDPEESLTIKIQNLKDEAYAVIKVAINKWIPLLPNSPAKRELIGRISEKSGLSFEGLINETEGVYQLDSVEGCAHKLKDYIGRYITFPYYKNALTHTGNTFYIWSKKNKELTMLPTNFDTNFEFILSQYVGGDFISWAKDILGNSPCIAVPDGEKDPVTARKIESENLRVVMRACMASVVPYCQEESNLHRICQGIHYCDYGVDNGGKRYIYFVNGNYVFRGTPTKTKDGKDFIEWEEVNDVVDNGNLFKLDAHKKWSAVTDISDLCDATSIDLKDLHDQIDLILKGWTFKNNDTMREYATNWILALSIMRAVGTCNITMITGESTSGKTSFTAGLMGGYNSQTHDVHSIIEGSIMSTDSSEAFVYQHMNGSSLLYCQDEAEANEGTANAKRTVDVQKLMYSIPTGGTKVTRGTADGNGTQEYDIMMPVLMSAINLNSDPVFLSRVITLETVRDSSKGNIADYIYSLYEGMDIDNVFRELRKKVTLAMIPYIPWIYKRRVEIRKEAGGGGIKVDDIPVTTRFVDGLCTIFAVYELVTGKNFKELYFPLMRACKERLVTVNNQTSECSLISRILYAKCIDFNDDSSNVKTRKSARDIITGNYTDYSILNASSCGVYYYPQKQWIVLFWKQLKLGALVPTEYRTWDISSMITNIRNNKYVVSSISDDDHASIVRELGLVDAKTTADYTVVRREYLVDDATMMNMKNHRKKSKQNKAPGSSIETPPDDGVPDIGTLENPLQAEIVEVDISPSEDLGADMDAEF